MESESREFKNTLEDKHFGRSLLDKDLSLHPDLKAELLPRLESLLHKLKAGAESARQHDPDNYSIYTGSSGMAMVHLHLHQALGGSGSESHLRKALALVEPVLEHLKGRRVTFLCGDAGPLALAAVLYAKLGKPERTRECVARLEQINHQVQTDVTLPDEVLYGRAGYLYALMFVEYYLGVGTGTTTLITQVARRILQSGLKVAQELASMLGAHPPPLAYHWHDKVYLGAAHGLAGIYYLLLKVRGDDQLKNEIRQLVRPCLDWLLARQFSSGNTPSSLNNPKDTLVQWCHGAPGWIPLFVEAYKVYGDGQYLAAARRMAEVIWMRGLLKKGCGLCHGTAGNAYAFLTLYRETEEPIYLHSAWQFAQWCFDYEKHRTRIPDTKYSLFEGLGGTVYFLADMLKPLSARFPAFEL